VTSFGRVYDPNADPAQRRQQLTFRNFSDGTLSHDSPTLMLPLHTDDFSWTSSGHEVQLGRSPAIRAGMKLHGNSILLLVAVKASTLEPIAAVGIPMAPGTMYMMTGTLSCGMPGDDVFWLHGVVCRGEA
jgi:hypothetical protein